jgi:DNA-binding FrmR family transcriptional regulator
MGKAGTPAVGMCGCATNVAATRGDDAAVMDGAAAARHAVAVDPTIKQRNLTRLRRIEGQVRGLQKMVEEERWCADVLTQVASVQEALRSVSRELLRNHLKHCAASAVREDAAKADAIHDELVELMFKYAR